MIYVLLRKYIQSKGNQVIQKVWVKNQQKKEVRNHMIILRNIMIIKIHLDKYPKINNKNINRSQLLVHNNIKNQSRSRSQNRSLNLDRNQKVIKN